MHRKDICFFMKRWKYKDYVWFSDGESSIEGSEAFRYLKCRMERFERMSSVLKKELDDIAEMETVSDGGDLYEAVCETGENLSLISIALSQLLKDLMFVLDEE